MDIRQITHAIKFNGFTNDELDQVISALKFARAELAQDNKRTMTVGSQVKFTSARNGRTYLGTVKKVAIKYITVDTGSGLFRVPANMLEVA
jgi:hypothetical protein